MRSLIPQQAAKNAFVVPVHFEDFIPIIPATLLKQLVAATYLF